MHYESHRKPTIGVDDACRMSRRPADSPGKVDPTAKVDVRNVAPRQRCSHGAVRRQSASGWGSLTGHRPVATSRIVSLDLIRRARRKKQLGESAQDDSAFKGEVPVFQIFEVARNAIFDV